MGLDLRTWIITADLSGRDSRSEKKKQLHWLKREFKRPIKNTHTGSLKRSLIY